MQYCQNFLKNHIYCRTTQILWPQDMDILAFLQEIYSQDLCVFGLSWISVVPSRNCKLHSLFLPSQHQNKTLKSLQWVWWMAAYVFMTSQIQRYDILFCENKGRLCHARLNHKIADQPLKSVLLRSIYKPNLYENILTSLSNLVPFSMLTISKELKTWGLTLKHGTQ